MTDEKQEKQEYQEVVIEVMTWPYVDIVSISGGTETRPISAG